jgi:hypothetical protein
MKALGKVIGEGAGGGTSINVPISIEDGPRRKMLVSNLRTGIEAEIKRILKKEMM